MKKIEINTLSRKYNVLLEPGILADAGTHILHALDLTDGSGKKLCVVTDATVNELYGGEDQSLMTSLKSARFDVYKYVYPGGEDHKNLVTVEDIMNYLVSKHFNRGDLLVAFGGGITGDIAGFTAAIYMRGIKYIQIPTTLLSSVDSSVGGKTGVNLKAGKNLTGAFWQPELVLFDPDVLDTLHYKQLLDGMGEMLKAGMIADKTLIWHILTAGSKPSETLNNGTHEFDEATDIPFDKYPEYTAPYRDGMPPIFVNKEALIDAIAGAINIKRMIVEDDEREQGRRKLLNFGHTIAHSIEKCSNYKISHGNAVAIGMCIVSTAADRLGWSREPSSETLKKIINYFGYPIDIKYSSGELATAALNDKKAGSSSVSIIYALKPGECVSREVQFDKLKDFIETGL